MIAFSIEKYLANPDRKVITRDGRDVRVLVTDMRGLYPVIAIILSPKDPDDYIMRYLPNGLAFAGLKHDFDIFFKEKKCVEYRIMDRLGDIGSTGYDTRNEAELMTNGNKDLTVVEITWEE